MSAPIEVADLARILKAKRAGAGWMARCPAHDDHTASLSIGEGEGGKLLLKCHAGCDFADILKASGVEPSRPTGSDHSRPRLVAAYDYRDQRGDIVFQVVRYAPKDFRQRRPDGNGGWIWNLQGVELVPYRLPEVVNANELFICEGEKDCDNLAKLGLTATTNPAGAGKWPKVFSGWFDGRHVVILPDNDESGRKHGRNVATKLLKVAASIKIVELPGVGEKGGDVSDWLAAGGTIEQLQELVEATPLYIPPRNTATAQHPPESEPVEPPKLAGKLDILAEFRRDVLLRGLVGENATAQLLYLAVTSRLLSKPVSVGLKGHSSSGKSHTLDRVLEFFPDEAVIKFTGMSERALIYREDDYRHRTLVICEVAGLQETKDDNLTAYFVRSLLSEGKLEYDVTIRGEGGQYTTQRITKEGPTNLIFTTTRTKVHAENETRVLSLNTDDSTEQTRKVLAALVDEAEHEVDIAEWRQLQGWLQTAEHRVTIPYGRGLAAAVPPLAIRLRRDFGAVLALIRAHAILHQQTRQRDEAGRIVAAIEDYIAVRELVAPVISEGIGAGVSDVVRETVAAVQVLSLGSGAAIGDIARELGIDKSNASRRVRRAADGGYIRNLEEKRGRAARWTLGEPLPDTVELLPAPEILPQVRNTERNGQVSEITREIPGCCGVAPVQEGIEGEETEITLADLDRMCGDDPDWREFDGWIRA